MIKDYLTDIILHKTIHNYFINTRMSQLPVCKWFVHLNLSDIAHV